MNNSYSKPQFCELCGSRCTKVNSTGFNRETGEQNTRYICTNWQCKEHCDFYKKHQFGLFGFGEVCKTCGYHKGDYI